MLRSYLPAVVFLCLGTGVGLAFAVLNTYLGPQSPPKVNSKADPYECGLPSDILYPVAVQLRAFGSFALVELIVFIALLLVAFVYVWRRGALEWR
jgi:NADH-quinone oxidoreductase subunit A